MPFPTHILHKINKEADYLTFLNTQDIKSLNHYPKVKLKNILFVV